MREANGKEERGRKVNYRTPINVEIHGAVVYVWYPLE